MTAGRVVALFALFLVACLGREPSRYYRFMNDYRLIIVSATATGRVETKQSVRQECPAGYSPIDLPPLLWCVNPDEHVLFAVVTNESAVSVELDWRNANYIDELGKAHVLSVVAGDNDEPVTLTKLSPGGSVVARLYPRYKRHIIRESWLTTAEWTEPLIPTETTADYLQGKTRVESLHAKGIRIQFVIPSSAGTFRFSLGLQPVSSPLG